MTQTKTESLLVRALILLDQVEQPQTQEWKKSVEALVLEYRFDDRVSESMEEDKAYQQPVCSPHTYSKAMGQRYPRRCVKCGQTEKV